LDNQPIGNGYEVKFPYKIEAKGKIKGIGEFAEIENNEIRFIKEMKDGQQVYIGSITGYDANSNDYEITIENKNSRAGVKIKGNRPLTKLAFWSTYKTVCPEPFISIKADPGETVTWEISYTFYSF